MWYFICILIGSILGTCFGVILVAIITSGSKDDEWKDEEWGE